MPYRIDHSSGWNPVSAAADQPQEWTVRRERGQAITIKLMVFIALRLGRRVARALLYPICAYYLVFSAASKRASRRYLSRVLQRPASVGDLFRHYHCFASCVLDRVFMLNDQIDMFNLQIEGEDIVIQLLERGDGCILFGAHMGSFEVLRALGSRQRNLRVSLVMYEDNARKIRSALNAINPALSMDIISLGRPGAMIEIAQRLDTGHFVGVLADRSLGQEEQGRFSFLGAPASFPVGPFRMAVIMKRPVVLMVALYRGGRRYDVYFERLFDPSAVLDDERSQGFREAMARYIARLEHYCKIAPYNWFNFYDFWR